MASTHPSDLDVTIFGAGPVDSGPGTNYETSLTRQIAHLPHVATVAPGVDLTGAPLFGGTPRLSDTSEAYPIASVNGLFFTQDRVAVIEGRRATLLDPTKS